MRAVLDLNVLISGLLSSTGAPARFVSAWLHGSFELIVSPRLLGELATALAYPKIRRRIASGDADRFVALLGRTAVHVADPEGPPLLRTADPDDDYLISLAAAADAMLVSGDGHLTALSDRAPIHTPAQFAAILDELA